MKYQDLALYIYHKIGQPKEEDEHSVCAVIHIYLELSFSTQL